MTLNALAEHHLVNEVVVARDGVEALDCVYRRGARCKQGTEDEHEQKAQVLMEMDGMVYSCLIRRRE